MKVVPNQKVITIKRNKNCNDPVFNISLSNMEKAIYELNHVELKVYLYMMKFDNEYSFPMSTKEMSETINASTGSIKKSITSLIDKGYIKHMENNCYTFYEKT